MKYFLGLCRKCAILILILTISSKGTLAHQPIDESDLSLWLIARTGWMYCERASELMARSGQFFSENKCKQCYQQLFLKNIHNSANVGNESILKCARTFGTPQGALIFREPITTIGVRAFTCNPDIMGTPVDILGMKETIMEPHRKFTTKIDPQRDYPRKSYVNCLMGKIFETEFALCTSDRLKCAEERQLIAERKIFSDLIPIKYQQKQRLRIRSGMMDAKQSDSYSTFDNYSLRCSKTSN